MTCKIACARFIIRQWLALTSIRDLRVAPDSDRALAKASHPLQDSHSLVAVLHFHCEELERIDARRTWRVPHIPGTQAAR